MQRFNGSGRVGGSEEIGVNVRIIAATNREMEPLIAAGQFREDLYYRLNVVPIRLPPLRERTDDIEPLARHFLHLAALEGLPRRRLTEDGARALMRRNWRGNVRELRNFIYRAALLVREDVLDGRVIEVMLADTVSEDEVPLGDTIGAAVTRWLESSGFAEGELYHGALAELEKPLFAHALARTGGNQLRAARLLGINRNTLRKRLTELGLEPEQFTEEI